MRYPEPESVSLEWKRELPANDQIIKTIIGFCNQFGGKLVLGVDSKDEIVGEPDATIESVLAYLEKTLFE